MTDKRQASVFLVSSAKKKNIYRIIPALSTVELLHLDHTDDLSAHCYVQDPIDEKGVGFRLQGYNKKEKF